MEILEKLSYVQQSAEKNKQLELQINQLRQEIQPLSMIKQVQGITTPSLPLSERFIIFVVSDIVLGIILNKIFSVLLTLAVNGWMTKSQSIAAGYPGYQIVTVIWPIGIILAIPLAFIATFIISKILKRKKIKQNDLKQQNNARIAAENSAIVKQNMAIQKRNQQIEEQITVLKQEQSLLKQDLSQKIPEYPVDYLMPEITAYVISQIQSGRANSINQAIVQYVAVYKK